MSYKNLLALPVLALSVLGMGSLCSCNSESTDYYLNPVNLAVTSFSLKKDTKNPGLDSVYFSIDLEHGVIFNADSLRKGTPIDKVIPEITFSSAVSEATIIMSGGTTREGEVDYKSNPTDSIDFTGNVELRVKAADGEIGMTYRIKVNVHQTETDSLFWDEVSYRGLTSKYPNPVNMKTVEVAGNVVSLIEENNGSYSIARYESMAPMKMNLETTTFPFIPDIRTFNATAGSLWMLDSNGSLWQGETDFSNWNNTGETWCSMIGVYNSSVIGLKKEGNATVFAQYPLVDLNEIEIPLDFPVSGYSNFVTLSNKWTLSPVAFFTGGVKADGTLSSGTWAFDGKEWILLNDGGLPAIEGASIIPYYNYRPSASGDSMIEYNVWLLIGGRTDSGGFNRNVYVSYNNGVDWTLGTSSMQLPEEIPATIYSDNLVIDITKEADLSDGWKYLKKRPKRISYSVDGDIITWECPYIYLFGGYSPEGRLYTTIWRGVLGRLTFTPII